MLSPDTLNIFWDTKTYKPALLQSIDTDIHW